MNLGLKALLIASTIALVPVAGAGPAAARSNVSVVFDFGDVAFAYSDGYWDREHRWHRWRDRDEAYRYRTAYREHYYDWRHDRDRDHGWRGRDRYWDHDRGWHKGWRDRSDDRGRDRDSDRDWD